MAESDRERLDIPTPDELLLVVESMRGHILRAAERGERAKNFGDVGYVNANRILTENPHLADQLGEFANGIAPLVNTSHLTPQDVYMAGARDILEILAITTNFTQLPDFDEPA